MRQSRFRSLRWKIAALTVAACCAVAAVIGVLVREANHEWMMERLREQTGDQLFEAKTEYERTGRVELPVDDRAPSELPAPLARDLAEDGTTGIWYDERPPNWYWMWGAVRVGDRVLVVRLDVSRDERHRQLLDRRIVISLLAALGVVVPLAVLATEPVNRRLRYGARTARVIADGDLDARIGRPGRAQDEITEMSAAVDEMAGALQRRLEDERRFTADVAHELRTPLMGLMTAAGLLRDDDEATGLVRDRVRALNALVEDLLEISRLDAGAERSRPDRVPLGEFVADVVRRAGDGIAEATRVTVRNAAVVETDPRRVERIVVNLVGNAHRHGAAPVGVTVDGARITVRDHGPGFPPDLLADGPRRFRTGADERGRGHGLGLTVAQGQAGVLGARLTFANAPDGGAVATLDLTSGPDPVPDAAPDLGAAPVPPVPPRT
ncbi:sensor histidine kinase [Streptomyces sp. JNUCC 64]